MIDRTAHAVHPSTVPVTVVRGLGADFERFAAAVGAAVALAIDTETFMRTGGMRVLSAATRAPDGTEAAWVVDVRDFPAPLLAPVLSGTTAAAWNANFDARVIDTAVFDPAGTARSARIDWWDAMLADALLHQGRAGFSWYHGLAWATERYLGVVAEGKGTIQTSFDATSDLSDEQIAYAAADAVETLWVADQLHARLARAGLTEIAALEMAARPFLDEMTRRGFPFDAEGYRAFLEGERRALVACRTELAELTGGGQGNLFSVELEPSWNPASEPQAKVALNRFARDLVVSHFLRTEGIGRTFEPHDRLDATTLAQLGGPLAETLLRFRHHAKVLSTYGDSLLAFVEADGRVRPQYIQVVGVNTGRLASRSPNAQNLAPETKPFVRPASGTRVLVIADLSQAELRWMAQLSGDTALRRAFREGVDVHVATAAAMFDLDMAALTVEDPARHAALRARAKTINFGILYGLGPRALARGLSLAGQPTDLAAAQELLTAYLAAYPGVADWLARHDRVVTDLAAAPPPVDWSATLRLLDELGPLTALRRAFRQRHDRWPSVAELLAELGDGATAPVIDPARAAWVLRFEDAVVLLESGRPLTWESRTIAGRRRLYDVTTWGVLRSAALAIVRRDDETFRAARDEIAAAFGVTFTDDAGRVLADDVVQKVLDNRPLRRALVDAVGRRLGEAGRDRLLDRALAERIGAFGNAHRNAPVQGGVADAMLAAYAELWRTLADDGEVWPIQTVHDSIVLECPLERAEEIADLLGSHMRAALERFCPDVPGVVDVRVAASLAGEAVLSPSVG